MDSSENGQQHACVADMIGALHRKGGRLWCEKGQLHYEAPKGVLTEKEVEGLRSSKEQILAFLANGRRRYAPLAFSQLEFWNSYQLRDQPTFRQLVSATRIRGRLSWPILRESFAEIIRRHDALRTRIVVCDGVPAQQIAEAEDQSLQMLDLAALPESSREDQIIRLIEALVCKPVDVATGPLFEALLVRLRTDEHVFILVIDHIIADGFSRSVILRDVFRAYSQISQGQPCALPPISVQFADWAVRQRQGEAAWTKKHGTYWTRRLAGCERARFPDHGRAPAPPASGWAAVPVSIDRELKAQLSALARARRTSLVMTVFAVYALLVLRWCRTSDTVISFQSNGRIRPGLENTVGLFASVLYLRVSVGERETFFELLSRVNEDYCQAHEHADHSYFASQLPRPGFTRNTNFNWAPQSTSQIDLSDLDGSEHGIACSPILFPHPLMKKLELDCEPAIQLHEGDAGIVGNVYFPLSRFSTEIMDRFGRNFLALARTIAECPQMRMSDIELL